MDRRKFLALFGVGIPATVVAEKLDLIEKARSYFFAPRGGWVKSGEIYVTDVYYGYLYGIRYYDLGPHSGSWHGIQRSALDLPIGASLFGRDFSIPPLPRG